MIEGRRRCSAATAWIHRLPAVPLSSWSNELGSGVACCRGDGHVMKRDGRRGPSPSRRPGPAAAPGAGDRGEKALQCCNRLDTPLASSPIIFLEQRARIRSGVLPAGDVAELGSPVGVCRAMAKSPRAQWCAGIITWRATGSGSLAPGASGQGGRVVQCCNRSRNTTGSCPSLSLKRRDRIR